MPTLNRNGVKIHYQIQGEGPVILLSHGFSASSEMWRGQMEALSRRHQLIVWDMRGHGETDCPSDAAEYSEAATVADMAALLDAAGADRAIVGGLSLGGYMSLAFHLKHPERVRALLVFDTGPGFRNEQARERWNQRALEIADVSESKGLALAARGMLTQRDSRVIDSLPNIRVPTLVVVGADDAPFLAAADYMTAKIPNAAKVVIADAGHVANVDQSERFNAAVVHFLESVEETSRGKS
jgi:pimeloyl-ACP methyl ester carboxylesterase